MSLEVQHVGQPNQRYSAHRSADVRVDGERPFEPLPSFGECSTLGPVPEQRPGKSERLRREHWRGNRPFECRAHIVLFQVKPLQPPHLSVTLQGSSDAAELVEEEIEMSVTKPVGIADLDEPFACVM